ncbi:MAG: plastocyanin/azurin family copper-binding protein [Nitrososphaeraceae archaeon]
MLLLVSWQLFNSVGAQDEEEEVADGEDTNDRNDNDDIFSVTISENAAWSQSIDQRFNPSNITIPVGAEVTWINEDEAKHTVTSGNVANQVHKRIYDGRFYSGILGSENSFSHIFNETGIYPYFCSPHPWMTGFVIVDGSIQDADIQDDEEEDSVVDEEEQNNEGDDDDE